MDKNFRLPGLDIVRSLAILFVITGHFFLNTDFFKSSYSGVNLFIQSVCLTLFGVAVPLFLLLTGYLNSNKQLSVKYYKSISRIIFAYLIYAFITILYRIYFRGEYFPASVWIQLILSYKVIPYGWYIEMYLCLFVLIPFLNIIYRGLKNWQEKCCLIVTFLVLTAAPPLFNRTGFHIIPEQFVDMYPITFYFIGAYIHEYKFKFSKLKLSLILMLLCLLEPAVNLLFRNDGIYSSFLGGRDSFYYILMSVIVFLLFYDVDFKSKLIKKISLLSLDMYLCSWVFDNLYYTYFKAHYFETQPQFFAFFLIIVPLVFFSSFGVAWLREKINWGVKRILVKQSI